MEEPHIRFWRHSYGVAAFWMVGVVVPVTGLLLVTMARLLAEAGVPDALAAPAGTIWMATVGTLGIFLHEAAHWMAFRILGARAWFADWWRLGWGRWVLTLPLPRSATFAGAMRGRDYAITVMAPVAAGFLLMLAGWSAFHLLVQGLWGKMAASLLIGVGGVMIVGGTDDVARVAALLHLRPPMVEESADGHMFRPMGEAAWISVNPFRHLKSRQRLLFIAALLLMAAGVILLVGLLLSSV